MHCPLRVSLTGLLVSLTSCTPPRPEVHADPQVVIPCVIDEGDLDFHDLLTACHYARERYASLFGREPHPVTIVVHDTTAMLNDFRDGRVFVFLPSNRAVSRARASFSRVSASRPHDPLLFVTHEILHFLLAAATFGGQEPPPGTYGTPLPDWFDEGVAIWGEDEATRASRMQIAADLPDRLLDLNTFARRAHPRAGDPIEQRMESILIQCTRAPCTPNTIGRDTFRVVNLIDAAGKVRVDTLLPEDPDFDRWDDAGFYAISSTILPFFHARGGSRLINVLLERLLENPGRTDVFHDLPGLPSDPRDVNREWHRFVQSFAPDTTREPLEDQAGGRAREEDR